MRSHSSWNASFQYRSSIAAMRSRTGAGSLNASSRMGTAKGLASWALASTCRWNSGSWTTSGSSVGLPHAQPPNEQVSSYTTWS